MRWVVSACLVLIVFLGFEVFTKEAKITVLKKEISKEQIKVKTCKESLKTKEFESFWSDEFSKTLNGDENESDKDSSESDDSFDSF